MAWRDPRFPNQEDVLQSRIAEASRAATVGMSTIDVQRVEATRLEEAKLEGECEKEALALAKLQVILKARKKIPYSWEMAQEICRRIADGEVLVNICEDNLMPLKSVVFDWLEDKKDAGKLEFQTAYARACKRRALVFEDELISIADDSRNDYMDKLNKRTGEEFRVLDPESLGRSKLRIDMRRAILKAHDPVLWGDNPNAVSAAATTAAINAARPNVIMQWFEAPKIETHPGDRAKVIEHDDQVTLAVLTLEQDEKVA